MTPAELWEAFLGSGTPEARAAAGASYTAWCFGTGGEMADELAALVLAGAKRATAGALWSYEHEGDPLPQTGRVQRDPRRRGRAAVHHSHDLR